MRLIKIFFINALVFVFFIVLILLIVPISYNSYNYLQSLKSSGKHYDKRAFLPNYHNLDWSIMHFHELEQVHKGYFDFIGWKSSNFKGETINVTNGIRVNQNKNYKSDLSVSFYGGSTMWGTGVDDRNTIPSIFERISNLKTTNYGESAWWSRQSFSLFVNNNLESQKSQKKLIIFYDGVNEVYHRCRTENNGISTNRQNQIKEKLEKEKIFNISYYFLPLKKFIQIAKLKIFSNTYKIENNNFYNCFNNKAKAKRIAIQMLELWRNTKILANKKGYKFVGILQPVAFIGNPKLNHLSNLEKTRPGLSKEYRAVYSEILNSMDDYRDLNILDLTKSFDSNISEEYIYIDFCHVSPNGNKIIANLIYQYLLNKKLI